MASQIITGKRCKVKINGVELKGFFEPRYGGPVSEIYSWGLGGVSLSFYFHPSNIYGSQIVIMCDTLEPLWQDTTLFT